MKAPLRSLAVVLLAGAFTLSGAPGTGAATRSITVTPNTNLVHGQQVTVTGAGFTPSTNVIICQGVVSGSPDYDDCAQFQLFGGNASGSFSEPWTLQRVIKSRNSSKYFDCARSPTQCFMGAVEADATGTPTSPMVTAPLTFTQQPPYPFSIRGTVTGPADQPLPGATVSAYGPSDTWVPTVKTTVDANGNYDIQGIEAGVPYRVKFTRPSGSTLASVWFFDQPNRRSAGGVIVFPQDDTWIAHEKLFPGGSISGSVTNATGAPLAGVTVWAYHPIDRKVGSYSVTTAANGTYRIDGALPATGYRVLFRPPAGSGLATEWFDNAPTAANAARFAVTAGQTTSGVDAQLTP